ncbi:hypothetical protein [Sphingomonas oryzagri]
MIDIWLTTHDAARVSLRDVEFARTIDAHGVGAPVLAPSIQ